MTPTRLFLGFGAGALSHLIFQGALSALLYAAHLTPELIWSLKPVPPLGVPATLNNMFWDGLWGIAYAWLEPRLTARFGRAPGGFAFSFAPLLVYWLIVLPLKGAGVGGGFRADMVPIQVAFETMFGVGTAVIFGAGLRLMQRGAAAGAPALRR
jgi:hypothetical protein